MMELERWEILMKLFGFEANIETFRFIHQKYSEKHRAYHNLEHINDCLMKLDVLGKDIPFQKEIELAIWFHDVIYNPYGKDNELKSANLAVKFIKSQNSSKELASKIYELIMVTLHSKTPMNEEEKIMMDIDISILGSDNPSYKEYSKKVRREYKLVPYFLYKKKRKEILSEFLMKSKLFYSDYFNHLEEAARKNLQLEINDL